MNRSARSMRRPETFCRANCSGYGAKPAKRSYSSRTASMRRYILLIGWWCYLQDPGRSGRSSGSILRDQGSGRVSRQMCCVSACSGCLDMSGREDAAKPCAGLELRRGLTDRCVTGDGKSPLPLIANGAILGWLADVRSFLLNWSFLWFFCAS